MAIESRAERVDDGPQISQQVFRPILSLVDNLDGASLGAEQGVQLAQAEARQTVLVLANDQADALVREQRQELGPGVVDAGPHLLDPLRHLLAPCHAIGDKLLGWVVQMALVL